MLGDISMNLNSLKEPRGFIKCVQTVLSMLAFSLYVSAVFDVEYTIHCPDKNDHPNRVQIPYPFAPVPPKLTFPSCEQGTTHTHSEYVLDFKSPSLSKFHVFMSVVPFIYCVGCIVYFVFFELDITQPGADRHQVLFYTADIGFSLFTVVFGAIACCCAMSVSVNLSYISKLSTFKDKMSTVCTGLTTCTVVNHFNHSNIIASILFQIANIGVWVFSLYMMWKDQAWKTVTTMPYDTDANNTNPGAASGATNQAYSAAYGNDYEYTYSN